MSISAKRAEIEAALRNVSYRQYSVAPDVGPGVSPPGAVIGAPSLRWTTAGPDPDEATWPVYVIVPADDRAAQRLWELIPLVTAALDQVENAQVTQAVPTTYPTSGGELPAYQVDVEVNL